MSDSHLGRATFLHFDVELIVHGVRVYQEITVREQWLHFAICTHILQTRLNLLHKHRLVPLARCTFLRTTR